MKKQQRRPNNYKELMVKIGIGLEHLKSEGILNNPKFLNAAKNAKNEDDSLRALKLTSVQQAVNFGFQGATKAESLFLQDTWNKIMKSIQLVKKINQLPRSVR